MPLRTCVGCRRKAPKQEMLRIVATKDGRVEIDPVGSMPGRGAYVCFADTCLSSLKVSRLEKALRINVSTGSVSLVSDVLKAIQMAASTGFRDSSSELMQRMRQSKPIEDRGIETQGEGGKESEEKDWVSK